MHNVTVYAHSMRAMVDTVKRLPDFCFLVRFTQVSDDGFNVIYATWSDPITWP